MCSRRHIAYILLTLFLFSNCTEIKEPEKYENQIGDTPFNPSLDASNFKFCDSTQVLHKRALVKYNGGQKALEADIIKNYNNKSDHESFSGYFIIRFAVNCNNETGRLRLEILDTNFKQTICSNTLENEILNIAKALKGWRHASYKGKDYDCYRFITIKMKNGKIINS